MKFSWEQEEKQILGRKRYLNRVKKKVYLLSDGSVEAAMDAPTEDNGTRRSKKKGDCEFTKHPALIALG